MKRQLVIWAVISTLIWNGMGVSTANVQPDSDHPAAIGKSREQIENALTQYLELAAELRRVIDRSQFDTEALLDALELDSDAIAEYVKNEIAYEPYPGLLRGPAGTLMSRAGNALDQSVLLAKLLNDAGFEARIVQGTLSGEEVKRLLSVARPGSRPATPFKDDAAADTIFRRMAKIADMPDSELERLLHQGSGETDGRGVKSIKVRLQAAAQQESSSLIGFLRESGIELSGDDLPEQVSQEAREYFWVQYRQGASEWLNLHPAFGSAEGPAVEPVAFFKDEIPERLQHRVRFQSQLVSIQGAKSQTSPLMLPWERPAANLAQRSITYGHAPLTLPEEASAPWQYLSSGEIFVPVLDGAIASDNAFDLSGNIIPMMAVQSAGADLVKTVSDKGRLAESALASLGASESAEKRRFGVSPVQLEITLISPGGEEHSFTRVVYNPCNKHRPIPANDTCFPEEPTVSDKLALTGTTTLAIAVGGFPESYALDRTLERIMESEQLLRLFIDPKKRGDLEQWAQLDTSDMSWLGFLPLFHNFDSSANPVHTFRPAPSAVLFQQRVRQDDEFSVSLDVLANEKRGLVLENGVLRSSPEALIYEGVWETGAEYLFLVDDFDEAIRRAFPLSRENGEFQRFNLLNDPVAAPDWGKQVMKKPLNSDYLVIALNRVDADDLGQVTWYRVDRSTGETLGMSTEGRGGLLEYLGKIVVGLAVVAPIYFVGCSLAGYDSMQCLMFARTVGMWGVSGFAVAISAFSTIVLWPSEAE